MCGVLSARLVIPFVCMIVNILLFIRAGVLGLVYVYPLTFAMRLNYLNTWYAIGHLICMHDCKYNAVVSLLYKGLVLFCMVFFLAGYSTFGLLNVFLSAVGRCRRRINHGCLV